MGTDSKSCIMYNKVKGETEDELNKITGIEHVSVFKPGLIMNRAAERTVEKIFKWIPFIPKISA